MLPKIKNGIPDVHYFGTTRNETTPKPTNISVCNGHYCLLSINNSVFSYLGIHSTLS